MQETHCISLPEDMTIGNISDCQTELLSALNKVLAVSVDFSTLQHIDTSGVQLLLVFIRQAENGQVKLIWQKESDLLSSITEKLGFKQLTNSTTWPTLNTSTAAEQL